MLAGGLLQHEPIHVHRALLRRVLPSSGPHEDGVRAGAGMGAVRLRPHHQKHNRNGLGCGRHGDLQLGCGGGQAEAVQGRPSPPSQS